MRIIFATQNQNKVAEIQKLIPENIQVQSLKNINCNEDIPETAKTIEGNASLKSAYVLEHFKIDCFADDTGLEVDVLKGKPGVKSARYASEIERSDKANIDKVLMQLEGITNRKAQFKTVISLRLNGRENIFEGICKGEIARERSGNKGFGYDPIFIPEGQSKSFAEMTIEEKNTISHRGKAINKLVFFLNSIYK